MNAPASLPEDIRQDISIYLAPEETVLKALSPFGNKTSASGQVWLILTSHSIVFHTCETGKEPLIAMLARKDIHEIEYYQRPVGVQLTFIPVGNSQKVSKLNFSNEKLEELEDFCEDLADLISFRKETASGIKTYSPAPAQQPPKIAPQKPLKIDEIPEPRHATSAIRHADKPEPTARVIAGDEVPAAEQSTQSTQSTQSAKSLPQAQEAGKTKPAVKSGPPEVKIVKPSVVNHDSSSDNAPANVAVAAHANTTPIAPPASQTGVKPDGKIQKAVSAERNGGTAASGLEFRAGYVIAATLISVLVAFVWYRFFLFVSDWKSGQNS